MRKRTALSLAAALLLLAGCAASGHTGGLSGVVNTDGSTSLANVMAALQEAFYELHPDITVNYSGTGAGAGVEAVLSGTCDIGLSSRALTPQEEAKGAVAHVVALDGIGVVVHPSNPVTGLTRDQLAQIFTGELVNWAQLGGEDRPIAVLGREAGSGTRGAFEELLGVTDRCRYRNEYGSSGDVMANTASNPNAIGYASLATLNGSAAVLTVDGVPCGEETLRDGTYPLQRPFLLVTREGTALSPQAEAFLTFALSPEAAEFLLAAGATPPGEGAGGS